MNAFQKQLKLGDKCMAELAGQDRDGIGRAVPPAKVSVEEFEASRIEAKKKVTTYLTHKEGKPHEDLR